MDYCRTLFKPVLYVRNLDVRQRKQFVRKCGRASGLGFNPAGSEVPLQNGRYELYRDPAFLFYPVPPLGFPDPLPEASTLQLQRLRDLSFQCSVL